MAAIGGGVSDDYPSEPIFCAKPVQSTLLVKAAESYKIVVVDLARVIEAARTASGKAYAPYSNFHVGAAVLTDAGAVYVGCNVENASYRLSTCAERNAVARMVADADSEERKIRLVAVVSPDSALCFPCRACRQVLREFSCEEVVVLDTFGGFRSYALNALLPHAFGPEDL